MAPRKKHGYTVVVFDANSSPEYKENAIACYKKINDLKFAEGSMDNTKIYLVNSVNAKNPSIIPKSYAITDEAYFHPTNHQILRNTKGVQGNLLEGIKTAADDLKRSFEDNVYSSFQLLVFSDLKTQHNIQPNKIKINVKLIVDILNEMQAYIYFFGVDFEFNALLESKKSVHDFVQEVSDVKLTPNLEIALGIAKETYGVLCPFELAVDLFFSYSFSKRGYPFLEPLEVHGVKIPTSCCKFLDKTKLIRPKPAESEKPDKTFVLADQQDEVVEFDDVKNGLALHDKFIFIPADVNKGLKNYPRFFKLLGFTDSKNVPAHLLLHDMNIVAVNENADSTVGYLNYLIEAAEKYNKYGIALKAHMKGCRPKLYALIPKTSPHYFIMKELPYAGDIEILYKETDPKTAKFKVEDVKEEIKSENVEEALFDFLDSINLDGKLKLHPFMRVNDGKKRQAEQLGKKAHGEEICPQDEEVLGLKFDHDDVLAKLRAVPVSTPSSIAAATVVQDVEDDADPW